MLSITLIFTIFFSCDVNDTFQSAVYIKKGISPLAGTHTHMQINKYKKMVTAQTKVNNIAS